ncbi:NADPH dehydrogenase NamA [Acetobacter sacchari]|uniref:NADPH dehydrogenase NamA n=1 Tax=Acetobacter sacchari TaxID=2661687 RepID=A0ABS3LZ39_9PROT|nr:NADPH dehydrogenase NamA [Acetobacter sacchari]MBO1361181.1 NADPH dehydrogenase NamA [Acetobacter sacchari]
MKLFDSITIRNLTLRNRIAMSPMCMHSGLPGGFVSDFHLVHYGARALGGAALVFPETLAILENGMIGPGDLGIWSDEHVLGLMRLVSVIHKMGAYAGAQLGHAGRMLGIDGLSSVAPSAIPFDDGFTTPNPLGEEEILSVIEAFRIAAGRARDADFDVLEIHTAHGYLLNEFLSPLANRRNDRWGGNHENRYRILRHIIDAVRTEWPGPLFVRISSTDYMKGGNTPDDFLIYGQWMKEQGVDLIDCSSGGIAPVSVKSYPGYQVPAATLLRDKLNIMTGAVGLIDSAGLAEDIVQNERADIVLIGRGMLRDPFWVRSAADELRTTVPVPAQYTRYGSWWLDNQPKPVPAPMNETEGKY